MTSITGFYPKDLAVNDFDQMVEVIDVSRGEIVFEWIDANKVDTLSEDEFDMLFTKVRDGKKEEQY